MSAPAPTVDAVATQRALASIVRGAGMAIAGRAGTALLGYAFTVLLARGLGADDLGLYSLGTAVVLLAMVVARLGLTETMLRFVALYRGEGRLALAKGALTRALRATAVTSGVLTLVVLALADHIADAGFGKPALAGALRGLAFAMVPANLALVALAATQACRVMTWTALVQGALVPVVQLGVAGALIAAGFGLPGALAGVVVAQVAAALAGYRFAAREMPELADPAVPAAAESGRLARFALPMTLVDLTGHLLLWIDLLILGFFVPAPVLGVYSAAARTAALISFLLFGVNALFAPTIADLANRGEHALLARLAKTVTRWVLSVALPLFLLCVCFGGELLALFGPEFRAGRAALAVLAVGQLVNAATGPVGYLLVMSGRQNLALLNQVVALVLAAGVGVWAVPRWGVLGAAVAVAGAQTVVNLVRLAQVAALMRLHPYDTSTWKPIAAAAAAAGMVSVLTLLGAPLDGPLGLAIAAGAFLLAYVSGLVWMGVTVEDSMVMMRARARMRSIGAGRGGGEDHGEAV